MITGSIHHPHDPDIATPATSASPAHNLPILWALGVGVGGRVRGFSWACLLSHVSGNHVSRQLEGLRSTGPSQ